MQRARHTSRRAGRGVRAGSITIGEITGNRNWPYEIIDAAVKVVGVGSVGTACRVLLLMARGEDPLILQVKEARASVLEA